MLALWLALVAVHVAAGNWERVWSIEHAPERLPWETLHVGAWLSVTTDTLQPRVLTEDGIFFDGPEWSLTAVRTAGASAPLTDVFTQTSAFFSSDNNRTVVVLGDRVYVSKDGRELPSLSAEVLVRTRADDTAQLIHTTPLGWNTIELVPFGNIRKSMLRGSAEEETVMATITGRETFDVGTADDKPVFLLALKIAMPEVDGLPTDFCWVATRADEKDFPARFQPGVVLPVNVIKDWKQELLSVDGLPVRSAFASCSEPLFRTKPPATLHKESQWPLSRPCTILDRTPDSRFLKVQTDNVPGLGKGRCFNVQRKDGGTFPQDWRYPAEKPAVFVHEAERNLEMTTLDGLPVYSTQQSCDYELVPIEVIRAGKAGAAKDHKLKGASGERQDVATILSAGYIPGGLSEFEVTARLESAGFCVVVAGGLRQVDALRVGAEIPVSYFPADSYMYFDLPGSGLGTAGSYEKIACPKPVVKSKAKSITLKSGEIKHDMATIISTGYNEGGYISDYEVTARLKSSGICVIAAAPSALELYVHIGEQVPVSYDNEGMEFDPQSADGLFPAGPRGYIQINCPVTNSKTSRALLSVVDRQDAQRKDKATVVSVDEFLPGQFQTVLKVLARLATADICVLTELNGNYNALFHFSAGAQYSVLIDDQAKMITFQSATPGIKVTGPFTVVPCPSLKSGKHAPPLLPYVFIDSATADNTALTLSTGATITRAADGLPFDQPHDHTAFFVDRRIDSPLSRAAQQFVDTCFTDSAPDDCIAKWLAMEQRRWDDLTSLIHDKVAGDGRWLILPTGAEWLRDRDPARDARLDRAVAAWTRACAESSTALDRSPTSCADFAAATDKRAALGFPTDAPATTSALPSWAVAVTVVAAVVLMGGLTSVLVARSN